MFRVLSTLNLDACPEAVEAFDGIAELESVKPNYATVAERIVDADGYLAALSVRFDRRILDRAGKLKVIGSPATGTDHLDLNAIRRAGIACFDISKESELLEGFTATSELVFTLILALNRQLVDATAAARRGDWARERFTGFQLYGKTLGILGMGRLGRITARIAKGFGMRVLAYDPNPVDFVDAQRTDFDGLFQQSDIISIHVHLEPGTRHFVNERALSLMKPSALLINTSRGGVVDEKALLKALESGKIFGAGLDVIDGEWAEDLATHPLLRYANTSSKLLITPHMGGATRESILGARVFMARKVAEYLRGC